MFGLIPATGLRLSEALQLRNTDVDLKTGMLNVRRTKFAKSRQVLMRPSTVDALRQYRRMRDRLIEVVPKVFPKSPPYIEEVRDLNTSPTSSLIQEYK